GVTSQVELIPDPNGPFGLGVSIDAHLGLPLALGLEALGGPVNGLKALSQSTTSFTNALQTGNVAGAATAVLDSPAVFTHGLLNGQATLPLSLDVSLGGADFPTTLNIPLDGLLVPPAPYTALVNADSLIPGTIFNATVTGTPLSGFIPGLLNFLPESL